MICLPVVLAVMTVHATVPMRIAPRAHRIVEYALFVVTVCAVVLLRATAHAQRIAETLLTAIFCVLVAALLWLDSLLAWSCSNLHLLLNSTLTLSSALSDSEVSSRCASTNLYILYFQLNLDAW